MRLVRKTAAWTLAAIVLVPGMGTAAQNEFDLDLKELRHGWANAPHNPHNPQPAAPASLDIDLKELRKIAPPQPAQSVPRKHNPTGPAIGNGSGTESIHVVRQGEHLFLILMKQYGLSNRAAELLIPEVMHLNGITSPKALMVGQRLRIPLALPYRNAKTTSVPLAIESEAKPAVPAEVDVADSPAAAEPASLLPTPDSINIIPAPPCIVAQDLLEKLGLLRPPAASIKGVNTVNAEYAGRSVTVACGLSEAEQYTYKRLLDHNDTRFLSLDEDEAADCVVEKLANHLGLVFSKQGNESEINSTSYVFAPFAARTHGLQLTIMPVPDATDR